MRTQRRAVRHLVTPVAATIRRFEPHLQTNLNVRRPPAAHYHAGHSLTSCARGRERLAELILGAGWTGVQWLDRTHQTSSNPSFSRPTPAGSSPPSGSSSGSYEERRAGFRFHGEWVPSPTQTAGSFAGSAAPIALPLLKAAVPRENRGATPRLSERMFVIREEAAVWSVDHLVFGTLHRRRRHSPCATSPCEGRQSRVIVVSS